MHGHTTACHEVTELQWHMHAVEDLMLEPYCSPSTTHMLQEGSAAAGVTVSSLPLYPTSCARLCCFMLASLG